MNAMSIKTFVSACLAGISLCVLLISMLLFNEHWKDFRAASDARVMVSLLGASTRVTEGLALERGATNVVLEGNTGGRAALDQLRGQFDTMVAAGLSAAQGSGVPEGVETAKALETIRAGLRVWRDKADSSPAPRPSRRPRCARNSPWRSMSL